MNWFLIALVNPVAHSIVNHLDKYLLVRYLKEGSVGTLVLFSSLFSVFLLPFIWAYQPAVLVSLTLVQALVLSVNGAILVGAIICYLLALENDEASFVAPLFQLIPVFTLVLGFLVLGERLSLMQLLAMAVILLGGVLISLDLTSDKFKLKKKTFWLMFCSSAMYGLNLVIFKLIAGESGFATSLFWDLSGKVMFGLILFSFVTSYRNDFLRLLKHNAKGVIGLNSFNETLALLGEISVIYAALLAPVALVQSVSSIQPLFVFLIGLALTVYFPNISQETLQKKQILQKISATAVIIVGTIMLNVV